MTEQGDIECIVITDSDDDIQVIDVVPGRNQMPGSESDLPEISFIKKEPSSLTTNEILQAVSKIQHYASVLGIKLPLNDSSSSSPKGGGDSGNFVELCQESSNNHSGVGSEIQAPTSTSCVVASSDSLASDESHLVDCELGDELSSNAEKMVLNCITTGNEGLLEDAPERKSEVELALLQPTHEASELKSSEISPPSNEDSISFLLNTQPGHPIAASASNDSEMNGSGPCLITNDKNDSVASFDNIELLDMLSLPGSSVYGVEISTSDSNTDSSHEKLLGYEEAGTCNENVGDGDSKDVCPSPTIGGKGPSADVDDGGGFNAQPSCNSDSNQDDSWDESDSDLLNPPAALDAAIAIDRVLLKAVPETPKKSSLLRPPVTSHKTNISQEPVIASRSRCHQTLDTVLVNIEKNEQLRQMEEELQARLDGERDSDTTFYCLGSAADETHSVTHEDPVKCLIQGFPEFQKFVEQRNRIQDPPPGLHVFKWDEHVCCCTLAVTSLESCGFSASKATKADKCLLSVPPSMLHEMVVHQVLTNVFPMSDFKASLAWFVFRLMSYHRNILVQHACQETLWSFICYSKQNNNNFVWCPPVEELVTGLLSQGAQCNQLCPLPDVFIDVQNQLQQNCVHHLPVDSDKAKQNQDPQPSLHQHFLSNMDRVLQTLAMLVTHWNNYSDQELVDLVMLLCWVSLDCTILQSCLIPSIRECVEVCLEKIQTDAWPHAHRKLSERLMKLGSSHHRHLVCLADVILPSQRGCQLVQSFSFMAVQKLLGLEVPVFEQDVTPQKVLQLIQQNPLKRGQMLLQEENYYLLYSWVSLLDYCIMNEIHSSQRAALTELAEEMLKLTSKVRETINCFEGTEVKHILTRIKTRCHIMIHSLPEKQKSLFSHSTGQTEIEHIRGYSGSESDDAESIPATQDKQQTV